MVNLAPYSFFNAVASRPPFVMFSSAGRKHSQTNAEETGEFVHSLTTWELREEMNITSSDVGPEISEAELARLEMAPSVAVKPPRVKRSPVAFECKYVKTVELPGADGKPIRTRSLSARSSESISPMRSSWTAASISPKHAPIARLGGLDQYTAVDNILKMKRPG